MQGARYSTALLTALFLFGCGGDDSPTAPTMVPTTPTAPTAPIVVTITAQVVNNASNQGLRTLTPQGTVESHNLRVTGNVDVMGGNVTISTTLIYTFTPDGSQPPATIEENPFSNRTIAPNTGGAPFTVDIPINVPPGTSTDGIVVIVVNGTDANGGTVNVSQELPVTGTNTQRPAGSCTPDANTLCMDGGPGSPGRFKAQVDWRDFDNNTGPGTVTDGQRFNDGGSFSFLDPDSIDLFVRLSNNCGSANRFWVFAAATTDVEYTLRITDTQTNQTRSYFNPLGTPSAPIQDTSAFATCP